MTNSKQTSCYLIHHLLENSADLCPDKVALIHEDSRATYTEINSKANQLTNWLISNGIQKGDRVIILLENSLEYVVSYYGILKSGAVAVPLSTGLKTDGLIPLIAELEPSFIIASFRFERMLKSIGPKEFGGSRLIIQDSRSDWKNSGLSVDSWESIFNLFVQDLSVRHPREGGDPESVFNSIAEDDLASIIYTSGSTGKSKGVMLSHKNIVSNTYSICRSLKLTPDDIQMVVLPFFYVMGKSLLNTIFAVGGTIVINNKFAFPSSVLTQMIDEKVSLFSGVPSTYAYLLHRSPLSKYKNQFKNLRMVTQAGGHMALAIKIALRNALPDHTKICIMYGATEASARLTCLDPDHFETKLESIGRAIPNVRIKIIDSNESEMPQGAIGEIVANGPNIMIGYWRDPVTTEKVLDEDGYHTGDIGWKDSEGFIFLEGRKDNLLKVGGHRINPQEIENAIMGTQLSIECGVVGISDDLLGMKLIALVVPKNSKCSQDEIFRELSKILPKYKIPREIILIKSLPKNASGKINRNDCLRILRPQIEEA